MSMCTCIHIPRVIYFLKGPLVAEQSFDGCHLDIIADVFTSSGRQINVEQSIRPIDLFASVKKVLCSSLLVGEVL